MHAPRSAPRARALTLVTLFAAAVVAGCAKQDAAAPAAAEATPSAVASAPVEAASAEAAPVEAAPTEAAPAAAPAIDTKQPLAAAPPAPERLASAAAGAQTSAGNGKWQAGRNYAVINPAQPTNVGPGKVEVLEVFWYGCGHCYELDPYLESWKKNKPAGIEFVRIPVIWGPGHKLHAKLFYTLQVLGKLESHHSKVFDTIHRGGNLLLGNDEASTLKLQRAWAEANGINSADFEREWNGFAVNTAVQRAEQITKRYRVAGVPIMFVAGKYQTDVGGAGGQSQLLTLLNDLAATELRR
jgi:thiol:disulfide interchange protein DsbA